MNPDAGCTLEELGSLNQLSGELDIFSLENVRDNVEAKSANLAKNAKLYKLGFHWRADEDDYDISANLNEITLSCCNKCEEVPTLGHLPCLQVLEINRMTNVRCIRTKFYSDGNYRKALFPTLRRLKLSGMWDLVEWKDAKELTTATCEEFPCLEELIIENCDELINKRFMSFSVS